MNVVWIYLSMKIIYNITVKIMERNVKFQIWTWLLLLASLVIPYQANAVSDFWTISIANPDNPSEWITIMDRNLWATSNDFTTKESFWYHYQWWNNYWFSQWCFSEGCSDYVTRSSKDVETHWVVWDDSYNNSWYYGTTFIKAYYVGYREDGDYHNWLWWWIWDKPSNNWWAKQTNSLDRQGPCPEGYHVPSAWEWWLLAKYWWNTYDKDSLVDWWDGFYHISWDVASDFNIFFKIPLAGMRGEDEALLYSQWSFGSYWTSSPNGDAYPEDGIWERRIYVFKTNGSFSGIPKWAWGDANNGFSVRCFKNTYEPEITGTKTVILKPWLNTFSTPAVIKSILFSNGWSNISFASMEKWQRKAVTVNNSNVRTNVKPLDGYIIRNSNSDDVTLTIEYDTNNSDSLILSKNLDAWWNFLWVTEINSPFNDIANTTVTKILDFTNWWFTNLIQLWKTFIQATRFMLWKSYAVFVNNSNWIYGGINNYGNWDGVQCVSMDSANVTHTIKDWIITLKWNKIQWDFVDISLYGNEERWYIPKGTVSMEDRQFDYKIERSGVHKFMLKNWCKNFYYTVNVNISQAYSQEFQEAYEWAYDNWIISDENIDAANLHYWLDDNLELADIMNKFAENIIEQQPDTSLVCDFGDLSSYISTDQETLNKYQEILTKSCHFWLIPRDEITNPAPIQGVNRAVFGTALSRALWWDMYEGGTPYYANHLNALKSAGIINKIDNPENTWEIKWYVLVMLKRVANDYYSTPVWVLTNNITNTVEFPMNESNKKTIFNGTYTILKPVDNAYGKLSSIRIRDYESCEENCPISWKIQFCLFVNGEEYCGSQNNINNVRDTITFGEISLERNKPINLRIDAEYDWISWTWTKNFNMWIMDSNWFITDIAMNLAPIKIVDNSDTFSIIPNTPSPDTVFLKGEENKTLAMFTLMPSNWTEWYLSGIILQWWALNTQTPINLSEDVIVRIDWTEVEPTILSRNNEYLYEVDETVSSEWARVEVKSRQPIDWDISISIYAINDNYNWFPYKVFKKRFESVLVYLASQEDMDTYTNYTLWVDKYNQNDTVRNLHLFTWYDNNYEECEGQLIINWLDDEIKDNDKFSIDNSSNDMMINCIEFDVIPAGGTKRTISINKLDYPDFFKVNGIDDRKVFSRNE